MNVKISVSSWWVILAALLITTMSAQAQSTNRKIGTQTTVTADPLVPRPREKPCVIPLFTKFQFALFSQTTQTFAFAPAPPSCSGPWEKVVLDVDFRENADRKSVV